MLNPTLKATGNTSNTWGFSNSVSDLLESAANSQPNPYESISSEDMLAKSKKGNEMIRGWRKEWERRKEKKMTCSSCRIDAKKSCLNCKTKPDQRENEQHPEGWKKEENNPEGWKNDVDNNDHTEGWKGIISPNEGQGNILNIEKTYKKSQLATKKTKKFKNSNE